MKLFTLGLGKLWVKSSAYTYVGGDGSGEYGY